MYRSKLLLNERPLLILPNLAKEIGLGETIILQQLHYWTVIKFESKEKYKDSFQDGYTWIYNSAESWQEQFPFWHTNTIRKYFKSLIDKGLVIKAKKNYNKSKYDRTNWHAIEYYNLGLLEEKIYESVEKFD